MVVSNSENKKTRIVHAKLVRRAICSFLGISTKKAGDIKFYRERKIVLEKELVEMRDIANGNNVFINKVADDALRKTTNN